MFRAIAPSFLWVAGAKVSLWTMSCGTPTPSAPTTRIGANIMYEPLAFYSAFADEELLWLAESYSYNDDFTELTIKTRPGIEWSDGVPFSAEDVAFTLTTLTEIGSDVRWGVDVQQFVESAEAVDENTVVVKLKVPAPRFFYFMSYKYDIGVYIVPKHIFEGQDWTTFKAFDLEKGWPVTTGPFKVVAASPEQKVYDRRDTWWAAEQGLAPMPEMERIVRLPRPAGTAGSPGLYQQRDRHRLHHAAPIVSHHL